MTPFEGDLCQTFGGLHGKEDRDPPQTLDVTRPLKGRVQQPTQLSSNFLPPPTYSLYGVTDGGAGGTSRDLCGP